MRARQLIRTEFVLVAIGFLLLAGSCCAADDLREQRPILTEESEPTRDQIAILIEDTAPRRVIVPNATVYDVPDLVLQMHEANCKFRERARK